MLNVSIINVSFAAVFLIQSFHANNFSGEQLADIWWALFPCLYNVPSMFFKLPWKWSSVLAGYNDE